MIANFCLKFGVMQFLFVTLLQSLIGTDVLLVPIEFRQSIYEVNEDAGCVNVWIDFSYMGQLTPIPESGTISM